MTNKIAPKLLPEFSLLVAGPGFSVNTELHLTREDLVLGLVSKICDIFKNETAVASLIYGADASNSRHSAPLGHLIDIQSYIFLLNSNIIFN